MKYDILVQIFTSVHPILSLYIFTGPKTIFAKKKSDFFSPKILDFFLSKSVLGYHKTKKKKKVAWTPKPLGGWVKSLVVRPLKKTLFYVCLPL